MTQRSWFWGGSSVGDAALPSTGGQDWGAPYTNDLFTDVLSMLLQTDRTVEGVLRSSRAGYTGLLAVTAPGGRILRVATGIAFVDGCPFTNDAVADLDPGGDGSFSLVLRKTWATQEVRLATRTPQGKTQTDNGPIWEIEIARATIAGGSVTVLTDYRTYVRTPSEVVTAALADLAVTTAKINDGAVTRAKLATGIGCFDLIERVVVGVGGVATIDFQNIPQTYQELKIIGSIKTDSVGPVASEDILAIFNNDSGANYNTAYWYWIIAPGPGEAFGVSAAANSMLVGEAMPNNPLAGLQVSSLEVLIPNYAGTTFYKIVQALSAMYGSLGGQQMMYKIAGEWLDNSAIDRITLSLQWGNFAEGAEVSLYGIG